MKVTALGIHKHPLHPNLDVLVVVAVVFECVFNKTKSLEQLAAGC